MLHKNENKEMNGGSNKFCLAEREKEDKRWRRHSKQQKGKERWRVNEKENEAIYESRGDQDKTNISPQR